MKRHALTLVGAGPANLALLIYLAEGLGLRLEDHCVVLEAEEKPQWHPGLCSTQTALQISMLKDLVCFRDPTSYFTFINFLKQRGVLRQYAHLDTFHPSRELYSQYLKWVSAHFSSVIRYDSRVERLRCDRWGDEQLFALDVKSSRFGADTYLSEEVVVSIGREPYVPPELKIDDRRVFHSAELSARIDGGGFPADGTYVVAGAGQSAGEAARYLLDRSTRATVHVASKGYLFRQIDDNPFVNDLYSDAGSRPFFALAREARESRVAGLANTNYGVVDSDLVRELYRIGFDRMIVGQGGLALHSYSQVARVEARPSGLRVTIKESDRAGPVVVDGVSAVVCATGYQNSRLRRMLGDLLPGAAADERVEADEFFEVKLAKGRGLFALNHGDSTYGLAEGTMTALAERAQRVGDRLRVAAAKRGQVLPQAHGSPLGGAGSDPAFTGAQEETSDATA